MDKKIKVAIHDAETGEDFYIATNEDEFKMLKWLKDNQLLYSEVHYSIVDEIDFVEI